MKNAAKILASTITLIAVNFATLIGMIVKGRPPARVRRWAQTAGRIVEVVAAIAMFYLALSFLLVIAGIKYDNPVTMYVGFALLTVSSLSVKALVGFCETLAKPFMGMFGTALNRVGVAVPQIDLGVQEMLTDISMCLLMCGVFALDGRDIGLTLACVSWVSLASLIAMIIMAGAQITIRRRLMVMFVAIFVIAHVMFELSPAFKEVVSAAVENTQVGERRVADVIRPNMPLAEVQMHQNTEQNVLRSELARYTAKVEKFERAAANHTPTQAEIDEYQAALKSVVTLREAIKLPNPEKSTWITNTWLSGYTLFTILFLGFGVWLVIFISSRTPKGGTATVATQGTPVSSATPAPAASAAEGHGGHSKVSFWHVFAIAAVVVAVILTIMFYNKIGQTQASNLPPAPAPVVVTPQPMPASIAQQTVANLEDFRVIRSDDANHEYEFQLDARQPWKTLPGIVVSDGDEVEFSASGLVCGGPNVGCVGPNGQKGIPQNPLAKPSEHPEEFPLGSAFCQALIGQIGPYSFQVGGSKTYKVPDGAGNQSIELMDNYRLPYINLATGGFVVKITIRKKA